MFSCLLKRWTRHSYRMLPGKKQHKENKQPELNWVRYRYKMKTINASTMFDGVQVKSGRTVCWWVVTGSYFLWNGLQLASCQLGQCPGHQAGTAHSDQQLAQLRASLEAKPISSLSVAFLLDVSCMADNMQETQPHHYSYCMWCDVNLHSMNPEWWLRHDLWDVVMLPVLSMSYSTEIFQLIVPLLNSLYDFSRTAFSTSLWSYIAYTVCRSYHRE